MHRLLVQQVAIPLHTRRNDVIEVDVLSLLSPKR